MFLRDLGCCELLLSLLRRIPWAGNKRERAMILELAPLLLRSLVPFLCVAKRVRSSQQKAAYAEMSKRCNLSSAPAQTWLCLPFAQSEAPELFKLSALSMPAQH